MKFLSSFSSLPSLLSPNLPALLSSPVLHRWKKVISLDPLYIDAYLGLAVVYFSKMDYVKSEEALFSALQISPDHLHTLYNLAKLYYHLGMYEKAVQYLTKVNDIQKDYEDTLLLLKNSIKKLSS